VEREDGQLEAALAAVPGAGFDVLPGMSSRNGWIETRPRELLAVAAALARRRPNVILGPRASGLGSRTSPRSAVRDGTDTHGHCWPGPTRSSALDCPTRSAWRGCWTGSPTCSRWRRGGALHLVFNRASGSPFGREQVGREVLRSLSSPACRSCRSTRGSRQRDGPERWCRAARRGVVDAVETYQRSAHLGVGATLRDPADMVARVLRSITAFGPPLTCALAATSRRCSSRALGCRSSTLPAACRRCRRRRPRRTTARSSTGCCPLRLRCTGLRPPLGADQQGLRFERELAGTHRKQTSREGAQPSRFLCVTSRYIPLLTRDLGKVHAPFCCERDIMPGCMPDPASVSLFPSPSPFLRPHLCPRRPVRACNLLRDDSASIYRR
jgi:hypothetical protein